MATGFFYTCNKSRKTLWSLIYLVSGSFYYSDAYWLVNARIVKKILSSHSTYQTRYKIRTNNWLALEADTSFNVSISCFAVANLHYGLFEKLWEGLFPLYLYGFSGPCHYSQYGQLFPADLNYFVFQTAQGQDSGNGADLNQCSQSWDEINAAALDEVNTGAGNRADVTKRPNCGNKVVVQSDDRINSLKKPVFLDGLVRTLD